jgi:hypothetical protein
MAKEVKGWREPRNWDRKHDDAFMSGLDKLIQSDDGWICPHCGVKETLADAEMRTEDVHNLVFGGEDVKRFCYECCKDYFLRCFTRLMYSSCADEKFEEE